MEQSNLNNQELWGGGVWKLYISRALTAWGDRLWSFGLGLLLFKIFPENLTIVAAFGLIDSLASITLGAVIGSWIDASNRLKAAKTFLVVQNLFVAIDCCIFAVYFHWSSEIVEQFGEWIKVVIAIVTIILALLSHLASAGSKIVVEKDWIVVISGGNDDKLAKLNSIFRTIDLLCHTVAPSLTGVLFSTATYAVTAVAIAGWNIVSVVAEYALLVSIYQQFSDLAKKEIKEDEEKEQKNSKKLSNLTGSYRSWSYFFNHSVRNAGLGLAFLYMTVLGFDSTTWAYSLQQCVPEYVLGVLVAASALVGIVGSLAFPLLRHCLGNSERTGVMGMMCLVASLSLCVVSVWLPGSPFDPTNANANIENALLNNSTSNATTVTTVERCSEELRPDVTSVSVLLSGIIAARFGLWLADLSITQIVQENVIESQRGAIGGVQTSLNSSFNLMKFCLVLIMPQENMFGILIILSFIFICFGAISLTSYACKEGKLASCSQYRATRTDEDSL